MYIQKQSQPLQPLSEILSNREGITLYNLIDPYIAGFESSESESDTYAEFKDTYWDDPVGFARDCFDWNRFNSEGLASYQNDILQNLVIHKRVCVRSLHGAGKTTTAAIVVLWFALTRDGLDWKILTTASVWKQLSLFLWPEIHLWSRAIKWDVVGRQSFKVAKELLDTSLKLETGQAFAVSPTDPAHLEGSHGAYYLALLDESKVIPSNIFDAIEGALSSGIEAYALSISTPGEQAGRFYEIQSRKPGFEDWHVMAIGLEDAIKAGRVKREWAEARARQWGVESSIYINRVLGNFAASTEDTLIPLAWIEAAFENYRNWELNGFEGEQITLGADIARFGADSVMVCEYAAGTDFEGIRNVQTFVKQSTMVTVGKINRLLKPGKTANIDVIGVGGGVVDRLREISMLEKKGWTINAYNASMATEFRDVSQEIQFMNVRAASYWNLRELLNPERDAPTLFCLPPSDELLGDLLAHKKKDTSSAKVALIPKLLIQQSLGRSPDYSDAVVIAAWMLEFETGESYGVGF